MQVGEFLKILQTAHDVPNYYNNKFPKNLGYYDGNRYSFDCWNLVKVALSEWKPTGVTGSYIAPKDLVTGDVDGATLLKSCTKRSKDFSKISVPGTYLYLSSNPHAGVYVGDFEINGIVYNVIECTKNAWGNGVIYSYVDSNGTRRKHKGSNSTSLKWSEYGLLTKYVEYGSSPEVAPVQQSDPVLRKGSKGTAVKELQKLLVAHGFDPNGIDGEFGPGCLKAVKEFQKAKGLKVDGVVGPLTWAELKKKPAPKDETDIKIYHTVKSGETLWGIAKGNNIPYAQLLSLNPQIKNPDVIHAGDKIRIK